MIVSLITSFQHRSWKSMLFKIELKKLKKKKNNETNKSIKYLDQKESQIRYLIKWKIVFLNMKKCLCQILISSRRLYWILQWFFSCLLGKLRTLFPIEITNDNVVFCALLKFHQDYSSYLDFLTILPFHYAARYLWKKEQFVFFFTDFFKLCNDLLCQNGQN